MSAVNPVPVFVDTAKKTNPLPVFAHLAEIANPLNWFGKDDEEDEEDESESDDAEADGKKKPADPRPDSAQIGSVFMVDSKNEFLLIRSSRTLELEYGTDLIAQNDQGRQTAELKLSPERKAAFLVADIVRGNPEIGDRVKLVGVANPNTGGIVPMQDGEVEVLE